MVDHINNGESGLSVREKLNEVIDRTNTLNGSENQIEANKNLGQQNSARIDKEIQDRIDGDEELWEHVNDVEDQLENLDVSVLDQKIDKEIADRIDGDANLQGQIDKEIADRTDGDAALQGQIDGLENYDDTQIKEDLATETQARIDGDAALQGQIDGLDLGGAIDEAPVDGKQYARKDASWSEIVPDAPSLLFGSWSYNSSSATTGSFTTRNANWFTATTLTLHKNDISGYEHSFELMTEGDVIVVQAPSGGAEYRVISKTMYADFCDFVVDTISAFGTFPSNGYSADFNFVPQVSSGGNGSPVVISDDPPANPEEGDLWYSSKADDEGLYCWDGSVWFEAGGANGADGEDGQDGKQIWSETTPDGDIFYDKGDVSVSGSFTAGGNLETAADGASAILTNSYGNEEAAAGVLLSRPTAKANVFLNCMNGGTSVFSVGPTGDATFSGTVDAAGFTINGAPISGGSDFEAISGDLNGSGWGWRHPTAPNKEGVFLTNNGQVFCPSMANRTSLGTSQQRWKDLNLSGEAKATDFIASSDERLKTRIAPIPVGLIDDIKPVSWDWIDGGGKSAGVVAQQLQEIGLGDYVRESEDGQLGVNYQALTAILLAEVIALKKAIQ